MPRTRSSRSLNPVIITTGIDRKSTRLNSSHANISYAVFCLKKKKNPFSYLAQMSTHQVVTGGNDFTTQQQFEPRGLHERHRPPARHSSGYHAAAHPQHAAQQ